MRFRYIACIIIALLFVSVQAFTQIGGTIATTEFSSDSSPYVVDKDIIIPKGKTLTITKGCVFLFKPFTGIIVHGILEIEGSPAKPVILTSFNDNNYNDQAKMLPNPFDWNGILIHSAANGARIQSCVISFSVYGVKSQTARLNIENGTFKQNGQFHCTVNDKILPVVDKIPFSWKPDIVDEAIIISVDSITQEKEIRIKRTRQIIRYSGLGLTIAGAGMGTIFLIKDMNSRKIVREYEEAQRAGEDPPPSSSLDKTTAAFNRQPTEERVAIASYILGCLGLAGFTLTFVF